MNRTIFLWKKNLEKGKSFRASDKVGCNLIMQPQGTHNMRQHSVISFNDGDVGGNCLKHSLEPLRATNVDY